MPPQSPSAKMPDIAINHKPTTVSLDSRPKYSRMSGTKSPMGRCPVPHTPQDPEDLEHDFTTPGKVGNLGCPFAKMAQNGLPDTPNSHDPLAAEFHQDHSSVASNSGLGKCPIRFLDRHSPEEIAQYFENHKHEIPRSHQVCVRRYQRDADSVRAMDAKYGNLVNMIQGLGVKHKQYLPNEGAAREETSSNGAVGKWAEDVSSKAVSPQPQVQEEEEANEERRTSHFERPLREIRVGESPSRPWGISVPVDKPVPPSALESDGNRADQPIQSGAPSQPVVGIPQSLLKERPKSKPEPAAADDAKVSPKAEEPSKNSPQQIIFNGPVFFGYSAEDAAKLLRSFNITGLQPGS